MLKVHRNLIRFIFPLFIGSLVFSIVLYKFNNVSWCGYWSNVFVGIMGSSLLSFISSVVGYYRERNLLFLSFYNKTREIVSMLAKYKRCGSPKNHEIAKENAQILREALCHKVDDLSYLFGEVAFVWDKHDRHQRRTYLFSLYQYFIDIRSLTQRYWSDLEVADCPLSILQYIDNVVLDINQFGNMTYTKNRISEDFDTEFDTLIKLINSNLSRKEKLSFSKTCVTAKVFSLLAEEDEILISELNKLVKKEGSRDIKVSGRLSEKAEYLFKCGLVSSLMRKELNGVVTGVEVSDKSYYYFGYKERYLKYNSAVTGK